MRIAEIIEDLERHIAKCGGEEVTENVNTRDLLAALKGEAEEDTPGGPWEIFKSCEGWNVRSASFRPWTEKQATAVRDVLNRLKGETDGPND